GAAAWPSGWGRHPSPSPAATTDSSAANTAAWASRTPSPPPCARASTTETGRSFAAPVRPCWRLARPRLAYVQPGEGPSDDHALDLRGSLEDREDLRVAVPALYRELAGVAVAAE